MGQGFDRKRKNMSQYSRSNKNQKPEDTTDSRPSRGEKVKQGLSVFQTVVATIASLLGIIVTSFTIWACSIKTIKRLKINHLVAPASSWSTIRDLTQALPIQMLIPIRKPIQVIQMLVHKKKPIAHPLQKPVHLQHKTKAPPQRTVAQIQHHPEPTKKSARKTLLIRSKTKSLEPKFLRTLSILWKEPEGSFLLFSIHLDLKVKIVIDSKQLLA